MKHFFSLLLLGGLCSSPIVCPQNAEAADEPASMAADAMKKLTEYVTGATATPTPAPAANASKTINDAYTKGFATVPVLAGLYAKYPTETTAYLKSRLTRIKGIVSEATIKSPTEVEFQMLNDLTPFVTVRYAVQGGKGAWIKDGRKLYYRDAASGPITPTEKPAFTDGEELSLRVALAEAAPSSILFDYEPMPSDRLASAVSRLRTDEPKAKVNTGPMEAQELAQMYAANQPQALASIQGKAITLKGQIAKIDVRSSMKYSSLAEVTLVTNGIKIVITRGIGSEGSSMMNSSGEKIAWEKSGKDLFYTLKYTNSAKASGNRSEKVLTEGEIKTFRAVFEKAEANTLYFTSQPTSPDAITF